MIRWLFRKAGLLHDDESGASFIIISMALPAIFGMSAFAIDLGYAYYIKSRLQNAADLAALAAGTLLVSGDKEAVRAKAEEYFYLNIPANWRGSGAITVVPQFDVDCSINLSNAGVTCYGLPGSTETINYVKVNAIATTPLYFASALGFTTAALSADAVVAGQGTAMPPLNVAIVLDSTKSMEFETTLSCGGNEVTKLECAKQAALGMIGTLWPTVDKVALYTYPGVSQGTGSSPNQSTADSNAQKNICGTGKPTVTDYKKDSNPARYQIVGFSDDYRVKTEPPPAGVLTESSLVRALGGTRNCNGLQTGSNTVYTFYADTIAKAQADLDAVNDTLVGSGKAPRQNVMVILSDGDANSTTSYIESARQLDQCQQGITAARAAADKGTLVYSVAYAAKTSFDDNCKYETDKTTNIKTRSRTVTQTCTRSGGRTTCNQSNGSYGAYTETNSLINPAPDNGTSTNSPNWRNCTTSSRSNCTENFTQTETTYRTTGTRSACTTMRDMASSPDKFFSIDPPGLANGCVSEANPTTTDLLSIFKKVASSLMKKRRVPKTAL